MEEELGGAIEASSDVEVVWSVVDGKRLHEASKRQRIVMVHLNGENTYSRGI